MQSSQEVLTAEQSTRSGNKEELRASELQRHIGQVLRCRDKFISAQQSLPDNCASVAILAAETLTQGIVEGLRNDWQMPSKKG